MGIVHALLGAKVNGMETGIGSVVLEFVEILNWKHEIV